MSTSGFTACASPSNEVWKSSFRGLIVNAVGHSPRDGTVTVFPGKVEIGQGILTALAQIVAEELDVSFGRVQVDMCNTFTSCNQGGASGSGAG